MGFEHALFEVANDVFKRTKSLSPEAIRDALRTTDFNTIVGPIHFNDKVPNCCPHSAGWRAVGAWEKISGRVGDHL